MLSAIFAWNRERIFKVYRSRVATFDRTLGRQNTGGVSAQAGFDFQDMVSVIELLQAADEFLSVRAQRKVELLFTFEQNSYVAVDDLVIVTGSYRRHIQIKYSEAPSWRARLVNSFWSDWFRYGEPNRMPLRLELVVSSASAKAAMIDNMKKHHLHLINVEVTTPEVALEKPYNNPSLRILLDRVSLRPKHDLFYPSVFSSVISGWKDAGRKGSIQDIFREISQASALTVSSLSEPSEPAQKMLNWLKTSIKDLHFSADGETLVVTNEKGFTVVPAFEIYNLKTFLSAFPSGTPSVIDFYSVLGGRRMRNRKAG